MMVMVVMMVRMATPAAGFKDDRTEQSQDSYHGRRADDDQDVAGSGVHSRPRSGHDVDGKGILRKERLSDAHDELDLVIGGEDSSSSSEPPAIFKRCIR